MIDFYIELKIPSDSSLDEIKAELLRQEQIWRRREITSPEKAQEMLVYINQAKKVFSSQSSKATYDRELEESRKKPVVSDPQEERYTRFQKWYTDAKKYYMEKQYDLAKTAIENALLYADPEKITADFYGVVCVVNREIGDYKSAINSINKAIVMEPDESAFYIEKGRTYGVWYESPDITERDKERAQGEEKKALETALSYARAKKDGSSAGIASGLLSYIYYKGTLGNESYYARIENSAYGKNYVVKPLSQDILTAEQYAEEAIKWGDEWGYGTRVNACIKDIRNKQREIEAMLSQPLQKMETINDVTVKEFFQELDVSEAFEIKANAEVNQIKKSLHEALSNGKSQLQRYIGYSVQIDRNSVIGSVITSRFLQVNITGGKLEEVKRLLNQEGVDFNYEYANFSWNFLLDAQYRWYGLYCQILKRLCEQDEIEIVSIDSNGYALYRKKETSLPKTINNSQTVAVRDIYSNNPMRNNSTIVERTPNGSSQKGRTEISEKRSLLSGNSISKKNDGLKQRDIRKLKGLCQYCGGHFKGIFTQKCVECGRRKDY